MNPKILACALGIGLCTAVPAVAADAPASLQGDRAAALAETFKARGVQPEGLEARLVALCAESQGPGDVAEALLIAGYDVYTVVRDLILACGRGGKGGAVAAQVASRALLVKGQSSRPLIDAGVLAAAAEIERRRRDPTLARAGAPADRAPDQAKRDLERERLERMMQKGLIDDEYREYIEERRRAAEDFAPALVPTGDFADDDAAIYGALYNLGLVGGGFYDDAVDPFLDPGGASSLR